MKLKEELAIEWENSQPKGTSLNVVKCFLAGYDAAMGKAKVLKEAIEFYAKGEIPYENRNPGDRLEFGCGCCAGIETQDSGSDCDDSIQGLTAREALAIYRGETCPE